jgi:hypothetical protein
VRKKERDYMGMFEYRKEDEHIIVKHLIHGMSFVCLLYRQIEVEGMTDSHGSFTCHWCHCMCHQLRLLC